MSHQLILAIDQGTTGSKVLLFDGRANIHRQVYKEITQHYPQPGWVEHDLTEIWEGIAEMIKEILVGVDIKDIQGIAITNQRETAAVWERETGKPLAPAVVWQCRRSVDICKDLKSRGLDERFQSRTGLMIDPYFSGTKVKWLLENVDGLREKADKDEVCFGTIDSWLLWNLTGGDVFATDYSNASRTLLYNIYDLCWAEELLSVMGIPKSMMPEVAPSSHIFGYTTGSNGLPAGIPIASMIGDSQGALFGEACFRPGMAKATYGTGTSLMMYAGNKPVKSTGGLVATLAWGMGNEVGYAFEGIINVTGATMQWLRDGLEIIDDVAKTSEIAASLSGNEGVYLIPAFVGLGAPYWDMDARGLIAGLTRGTTRKHLIRAGLESIAYQVRDVVELMQKESGIPLTLLRADGGAAGNEFLMNFQAGILNVEVARPHVREVSALGAAYLAGLKVGMWSDLGKIAESWKSDRVFSPGMSPEERDKLYNEWKTAVGRALTNK